MRLKDLVEAANTSPVKKELDDVKEKLASIKAEQHSLLWQAEKLARKDAAADGIDLRGNTFNARWLERENREKRPDAHKLSTSGIRGAESNFFYFTDKDLLNKAKALLSEIRKLSKQRRDLMLKKKELQKQHNATKTMAKPRGLSAEHIDADTLENIKQMFDYIVERYQDYYMEVHPKLEQYRAYKPGYRMFNAPRFHKKGMSSDIMKAFGYVPLPRLGSLRHTVVLYAEPNSQEENNLKELLAPLDDMVEKATQLARQYNYIKHKLGHYA